MSGAKAGKRYFAGIKIREKTGISSENVFIKKNFLEKHLEWLGVFFTPTISHISGSGNKIRMHVVSFSSKDDYIVVSRPLSFSVDDILPIIDFLRGEHEIPVIVSVVADRLSRYKELIKVFNNIVDGIEIDLGLFYTLYGYKRGFESYAIDIIEELVSYSPVPIIAKITPNMPMSLNFLENIEATGLGGFVFSPHPIYSVGNEIFRIHSVQLSTIYSYIWAGIVVSKVKINTAFISDTNPLEKLNTSVAGIFDLILFDTYLLFKEINEKNIFKKGYEFPLKWRKIPQNLRPALFQGHDSLKCARVCPYNAFNTSKKGLETLIIANEDCDRCGLCITLCDKKITLAKELLPE